MDQMAKRSEQHQDDADAVQRPEQRHDRIHSSKGSRVDSGNREGEQAGKNQEKKYLAQAVVVALLIPPLLIKNNGKTEPNRDGEDGFADEADRAPSKIQCVQHDDCDKKRERKQQDQFRKRSFHDADAFRH